MYFNYFALRDNSVLLTFFAEKTPRSRKVKNTQKCINSIHCTANVHRGFTGFPSFFPAISMKEGCKNHRETLYSSKGKIVYVVGKPYYYLQIAGKSYNYHGVSPQYYSPFPYVVQVFLAGTPQFPVPVVFMG